MDQMPAISEAERVLDDGYAKFEARLAELRLSPSEFLKATSAVSYSTYWRGKNRAAKVPGRTRTLRLMEQALEAYGAKQKEDA